MNDLIHCVYASKASPKFRERELPVLLAKARDTNLRRAVTGMLLYIEGSFFQVLEGPQRAVDELYASISEDERHIRVTRIIREPIFERDFGEWTMGYASLGVTEVAQQLGENDFFTGRSCWEQMNPGRAKKLLHAFSYGRWRAEATGTHHAHSRMR